MKKQLLTICLFLLSFVILAQSPQSFKYQTVVRDNTGAVLSGQNVSFRINLRQASASGSIVYSETHSATTNQFGLVSLQIGLGTVLNGTFANIDWANNHYWMEIELDATGGNNFQTMGCSELLSVPYALHAQTASDVDDADADPANEIQNLTFSADSIGITGGNKIYHPQIWSKSGSDAFRATGKVGIGVSSPSYRLDVNGNANLRNGEILYNGDNILSAPSSGNLFVGINAGNSSVTGAGNTLVGEEAGKNITSASSNTIVGQNAGKNISTGSNNSFYGGSSGESNTTGYDNVFVGESSGKSNTSGNSNLFLGTNAGYLNSSGKENVFVGKEAGMLNTTGSGNVFLGYSAGTSETGSNKLYIENSATSSPLIYGDFANDSLAINGSLAIKEELIDGSGNSGTSGQILSSTGTKTQWTTFNPGDDDWSYISGSGLTGNVYHSGNVAIGQSTSANKLDVNGSVNITNGNSYKTDNKTVLFSIADTLNNVYSGINAGNSTNTGTENSFFGVSAGNSIATGERNTFVGMSAGSNVSSQERNTFVGAYSGFASNGEKNTFIGHQAGYNVNGGDNTFVGDNSGAGLPNASGTDNTFVGQNSGLKINTGSKNTFIGKDAGHENTDGSANIFIGYNAGYDETGSNKLYIDNSDTVKPLIYGDFANDSLAVNGSLSVNHKFFDSSGDAGTAGQFLSSTANGTDWTDLPDDNDWSYTSGSGLNGNAYHIGNISIGMSNSFNKLDVDGSVSISAGNSYKIENEDVLFTDPANGNTLLGNTGNTSLSGNHNTLTGTGAGYQTTTGEKNSILGSMAGYNNTEGTQNTFIGHQAGFYNTTGNYNTYIGQNAGAGSSGATGISNTCLGAEAGFSIGTASDNTYLGRAAGYLNASGSGNVYIGSGVGMNASGSNQLMIDNSNTTTPLIYGDFFTDSLCINGLLTTSVSFYSAGNIDIHKNMQYRIDDKPVLSYGADSSNIFTGVYSGNNSVTGSELTCIGLKSGYNLTSGGGNTFIGSMSGSTTTDGNNNTFVGKAAGQNNQNGSGNVFLGYEAGKNETGSNKLYIDNSDTTTPLIYGEFDNDLVTVNGEIKITGGSPGSGKVLTSDANGLASWQYADTADNLGNHTATQNLIMGTNWVSGDGDNEGVFVASDGKVGIGTSSPGGNLDVAGGIWQTGTGQSVFLGEGAGNSDNLSDNRNVFVGYRSGYSNTTGYNNTASGYQALYSNTTGFENIASGYQALYSNIEGFENIATGYQALYSNTEGVNNIANGKQALYSNTEGANNIANSYQALYSNTTGSNNIANGYQALYSNTIGGNNIANGSAALYSNTEGYNNIANGSVALYSNTEGHNNIANGSAALYSNTEGHNNIAIGNGALFSNTIGYSNIATGNGALKSNTTGYNNIASGYSALNSNTEGNDNIANGNFALANNTTGYNNIASGYMALFSNTIGYNNTAIGIEALYSNTAGDDNIASGYQALYSNTTGYDNIANGELALYSNTDGDFNIATGYKALYLNTDGDNNIASGYYALYSNTTGYNNTALGSNAFFNGATYHNSTAIGSNSVITADNRVVLGDNNVTWIGGHSAWNNTSDGRFKRNVNENVKGLDFIMKLRPVTYTWDIKALNNYIGIPDSITNKATDDRVSAEKIVHTGFIAQEVEQAALETGYDFDGVHHPSGENDPYSLAYSQFVVPLVKALQEQQEIIEELKSRIEKLEKTNKNTDK